MIAQFLKKKENLFIVLVGLISVFFVTLGFVFLIFRGTGAEGPKTVPVTVADIAWKSYRSNLLDQKVEYPRHLFISEQKEESGVGLTVSDAERGDFLTYFSNQNHFSVYPSGIDQPLYYAKTRSDDFASASGQQYARTEYLTADDEVWAVMLVPKTAPRNWQANGFVWIQAKVAERESLCMSQAGVVADTLDCDPFKGEKTVYAGRVSGQFLKFGYEIANKNTFNNQ